LAAGGNLNPTMFGPGVKPPMPAEAIFPTAPKHGEVWPEDAKEGPAVWRRGIYVVTQRSNPVPFLQTFDAPDSATGCARRSTTTVPTQALILMNDPFVRGQAARLAGHVRSAGSDSERVRRAFELTLGRPPTGDESAKAVGFLERGGPHGLADLCQVLFQTNEFIYVD
jgi:hypothetical protein